MKKKCDNCDKLATVHLTEIIGGKKIEKHLCEDCAASEGITIKADVPISQLLEDFILQSDPDVQQAKELVCDVCGMRFSDFREKGVLGCPHDYEAFEPSLLPLIAGSHEGHTQHTGKVPPRADNALRRQNELLRLRADLKQAVAAEEYEKAAGIRDRLKEVETE